MIDFSFLNGLWIAFILTSFASFFVFFARQFKLLVMGASLALSGISLQFLDVDIFRISENGQIIVAGLWILFLFQIIAFKWILITKTKLHHSFFFLPFLAFVSMAISLDLLTFALGLSLFNITFTSLSALKGKPKEQIFIAIQKMMIAFLSYAYGMAILFSREGNILFNRLYPKLSKLEWDEWTTLGIGLIVLAIGIELYAIIPLIGKKNEKV
ncbi:MAG: hypothetical protein J6Y03_06240 [Alphaproteobacteria bacterium]|nr:hypothetical protein [Alphaproteobacteria bacterium]